ncbi:MAG: acyl-CoA thioesterase [Myxococcota bacterium]|nr:acyl-CoA thioesterase [Myxococcota bacterium]
MSKKTVGQSSCYMANVMLPMDANVAGFVHGGVVMKYIDNAAGVAAMRHSQTNCVTASIDRLDFHNPVFIGNLLMVKASLNLVNRTSMEVGVRVECENFLTGELTHTASAYLTFVALGSDFKPVKDPLPSLIFETDIENRRNREAIQRRKLRLAEKTREKVGQTDVA